MDMEPRPEPIADEATRNAVAQRIEQLEVLDPIIHQPTRLRLMARLAQSEEAVRSQALAGQLQVQASLLSMHLTTLHRAGFIALESGQGAVCSDEHHADPGRKSCIRLLSSSHAQHVGVG